MCAATTKTTIRQLGEPGDLGWVVMAHGETYAREFGWNTEFEALVLQIVDDFAHRPDDRAGAGWIAEHEGRRAGCVLCVAADEPGVATLRTLLVDPAARGHRLGDRLVATAIDWARDAGFVRLRLWTDRRLAAARKIYLRAGFVLTGEQPHRAFGADLVSHFYERELRPSEGASA